MTSENVAPRVPADADSKQDQPPPAPSSGRDALGDDSIRMSMEHRFETLYRDFHGPGDSNDKPPTFQAEDSEKWQSNDNHRASELRIEDAKVRALNSNGRVDYSVQE